MIGRRIDGRATVERGQKFAMLIRQQYLSVVGDRDCDDDRRLWRGGRYRQARRWWLVLDLKNPTAQQEAMEAFFFGYQAFTAKADEMLERRGLSRVHQRIVFFIARYPALSVKELLELLGVSKQALNIPLRQLQEMHLVNSVASETDKRKRLRSA